MFGEDRAAQRGISTLEMTDLKLDKDLTITQSSFKSPIIQGRVGIPFSFP